MLPSVVRMQSSVDATTHPKFYVGQPRCGHLRCLDIEVARDIPYDMLYLWALLRTGPVPQTPDA